MDTERFCQHCGKPLTPKAVQGLCPECFLKVGLGSAGPGPAGFVPPRLEELAPHFPQLEILEPLGRGGMGAVYKARQKALNRLVALKVLPPDEQRDPAFAERFTREAQALARLNHPNIVTVHEFGQAGGFYFFVMEFVDGLNLRQMLRAHRLSPREAMSIVPQICEALQYAHDQGIVHRDIKPENVLVDKQGRVKIADFGLAKLLGKDPQGDPLTRSAEVMGTPQYMAPEQIERPLEVDHRADIYSLGVVFYEMLTGELPLGRFAAPSKKVQVDVRLDEIVLRALEKEPELRYQQASAFKTHVETISGTPPPVVPPPGPAPAGAGQPSAPERRGFKASSVPWQIWVAVGLLALEGLGNIVSIPRHPEALIWLAAKCLFIVGLLRRWRPVFVLVLLVTALHVVYFLPREPFAAALNLILIALIVSAFRYYLGGSLRRISMGRAGAVMIAVFLLLLLGLATFALNQRALNQRALNQQRQMARRIADAALVPQPIENSEGMEYAFGPMFERVFSSRELAQGVFIDLDWAADPTSGRAIQDSVQRRRSGDVDVFHENGRWRMEGVAAITINEPFPKVSAAAVTQIDWRNQNPGSAVLKPGFVTYMFNTREGAMGVFQVSPTPENSRSITVRFRVVQAAAPKQLADAPVQPVEPAIDGATAFLMNQLVFLEEELRMTDTANHPRVQQLQTEIERTKDQIKAATSSRTFSLRHRLASEMTDDLRQVLQNRSGQKVVPHGNNVQLTVTAPPAVLNRAATFIAVQDWPERIQRGSDYSYPRGTVEVAARSFFHACAIEDIEGVSRMLSPGVLAALKGTNLAAHGVPGEEKDAELVREGNQAAVRSVVDAWNRFPLRQLRRGNGVAIGFGLRHFASAAFEGAPEDFVQLAFVPDRTSGTNGPLLMDVLPPWHPRSSEGDPVEILPLNTASTGESVRDLNARFKAAQSIRSLDDRGVVMAAIARDAVRAGDADLTRKAVAHIPSVEDRGKAAAEAARELARNGRRDEARRLAILIPSLDVRDAILRELAE